jgi:hypothetical protein
VVRAVDFAGFFVPARRVVALLRTFRRVLAAAFRRAAAVREEARAPLRDPFRATGRGDLRARADLFATLRFLAALRAAFRGVLDLAMSRPFAERRLTDRRKVLYLLLLIQIQTRPHAEGPSSSHA